MRETKKSYVLRESRGDFTNFLHGSGIDIGCGKDKLTVRDGTVVGYDKQNGDATILANVNDAMFDFVYSSHCLEHLSNIPLALQNWTRVIKGKGYLYFTVPDYELYEKCSWPSKMNHDHKASFSMRITKKQVKRQDHYHADDINTILTGFGCNKKLIILEDEQYDYNNGLTDQTRKGALAQICFIYSVDRAPKPV